jgi:hypothetical protein
VLPVQWTVVVTVEVPNLISDSGALADDALGFSAVMESNRGGVERQITLTVDAADESGAREAALEQLMDGLGAELSGVPIVESIRVEAD